MTNETRKEFIKNLEQHKQEELLFHNEERAKYFDEVIKVLKEQEKKEAMKDIVMI